MNCAFYSDIVLRKEREGGDEVAIGRVPRMHHATYIHLSIHPSFSWVILSLPDWLSRFRARRICLFWFIHCMGFIYGYVWMEPTMAALEQIAPAKVGCKQDMIFVQHNRAASSFAMSPLSLPKSLNPWEEYLSPFAAPSFHARGSFLLAWPPTAHCSVYYWRGTCDRIETSSYKIGLLCTDGLF